MHAGSASCTHATVRVRTTDTGQNLRRRSVQAERSRDPRSEPKSAAALCSHVLHPE